MRVVSVLPSATEIVCALGHRPELVARSAECDFPLDVATLPAVMRPRTRDFDRPSGAIDARVQAARGRQESLYELDIPLLRALRPDLLITQDLCGVCSVTEAEVAEACAIAGVAPHVLSLSPRTLPEVWRSVEEVGAALGDAREGVRLAAALRERASPDPARSDGPRVAVVEWLDPPILAGLWAPDIVRAAGGTPAAGRSGEPGTRTSWREVRSLRPDLLVLSPCSFSVERSRQEMADARIRTGIASVEAPLGTFVADEAYFSRPGPRLADGVELVRHLLARTPWRAPMPYDRVIGGGPEATA